MLHTHKHQPQAATTTKNGKNEPLLQRKEEHLEKKSLNRKEKGNRQGKGLFIIKKKKKKRT